MFPVPASVASFSPLQPSYVVGDAITAVVVGNPTPSVQWTAVSSPYTSPVPSGLVLNITDKMIGVNVWNCSASNVFGSGTQQIMFNVTGMMSLFSSCIYRRTAYSLPLYTVVQLCFGGSCVGQ
jgi:hypothetical protein